jgi:hypothetical protein
MENIKNNIQIELQIRSERYGRDPPTTTNTIGNIVRRSVGLE